MTHACVRQHAMKMGDRLLGRAAGVIRKAVRLRRRIWAEIRRAITQARLVLPDGHAAFSGDRCG
jgi:hypothetical protein